ncbi:MAG: GNAT family N-acetyltransferase [Woeseiaceae bacterium]|nr:GNAT family N-acetyltransferase [Woeseiaceae bacterium]
MSESPVIREAYGHEAGLLSALALRSKAHWGYSPDFLESCRNELTVDESRIGSEDYHCFVVVERKSILGFYVLECVSERVYELDALFVEPAHIGTGIGRLLIQHALHTLSKRGAARLIIQGDPNATKFYRATGARQIGTRESGSIRGRYLPLYEIEIDHV